MNIIIESVDFKAGDALETYVKERLNKFFGPYDYITQAMVYLKKVPETDQGDKIAEIELRLPGTELYADSQADTYQRAVSETIDKVRRQLEKYKERFKPTS